MIFISKKQAKIKKMRELKMRKISKSIEMKKVHNELKIFY